MDVDPNLIHRLFYPQVPAIMSAQYEDRVSAMPVVSYASVSNSPPMVAVACNPDGYTCKLAQKVSSFSLCILDRNHIDAIERLATTSGAKVKDKLLDAGLAYTAGRALNVPVIAGAHATMECSLETKVELGDHLLLVGLIRAAYAADSFTEFWSFDKYHPILYTGWKNGMTMLSDV